MSAFILFTTEMFIENFILDLQECLSGSRYADHNIIRKHSRKLEQLGDVSFPLNIKNWSRLLDKTKFECEMVNIFDYNSLGTNLELQIEQLKERSKSWPVKIERSDVDNNDVHIFIDRSQWLYKSVLQNVFNETHRYGSSEIITNMVSLEILPNITDSVEEATLSTLRLVVLKDVSLNLLDFSTSRNAMDECAITLSLQPVNNSCPHLLCGPVLNENGVKSMLTAGELYGRRTSDMRMMAQHKYGLPVKLNETWKTYFEKLGRGSVIIEMLSNKPIKPIKITKNDLKTANKGASFIFYNCARLAAIFKKFEKNVFLRIYPDLPKIDEVDFSLLGQPEEWELFFAYVLQFPNMVRNCIKDIEKGIINPQYLISFLSNLCSLFSAYYRRVRVLREPKEHLFSIIHARIYLLKAIECVFHNGLRLLNIEPIKQM